MPHPSPATRRSARAPRHRHCRGAPLNSSGTPMTTSSSGQRRSRQRTRRHRCRRSARRLTSPPRAAMLLRRRGPQSSGWSCRRRRRPLWEPPPRLPSTRPGRPAECPSGHSARCPSFPRRGRQAPPWKTRPSSRRPSCHPRTQGRTQTQRRPWARSPKTPQSSRPPPRPKSWRHSPRASPTTHGQKPWRCRRSPQWRRGQRHSPAWSTKRLCPRPTLLRRPHRARGRRPQLPRRRRSPERRRGRAHVV
mmetsp:Transcript_57165/g.165827  ORF Transcript_57165/g.165827 Transcript_57165/m.165827 type:complete len:248 (+) Transcript_57165:193-936(+)